MNVALYRQKKQKIWLWIAYDRNRRQVVDFQLGRRDINTGYTIYMRLQKSLKCLFNHDLHYV